MRTVTTLFLGLLLALTYTALAEAQVQAYGCASVPSGLAIGSSGSSVLALQKYLVAQNYPGGGSWMETGYYGEATAAAVRNFQTLHGLAATGSVDASTALAMSGGCAAPAPFTSYGSSVVPVSGSSAWYGNPTGNSTYGLNWSYPNAYQPYQYQTSSAYYPGYPGYYPYQGSPAYYGAAPVITSLSQNTGYVGQSVTIYGVGFDPYNNTVVFNGYSFGNIPSPSGTSLVFTIPSYYNFTSIYSISGSQVQLYVSNARGTSNSLTFTLYGGYGCGMGGYASSCYCGGYPYTYGTTNWNCPQPGPNNTTAPSILYLDPAQGGVGTNVTVYGSGFTYDNNTVHFGVGVIAGLRSSDGRSVSFVVPSTLSGFGTQPITLSTYPVSVTNSLGYTTNSVPFSVTSLSSGGQPVISSVSGPNALATGQQGTWTVNVTSGYGQYLTFNVDWGDSAVYPYAASAQQAAYQTNSLTHTYYHSGTYTIRFTVTNSYGQSNAYTTTVTVSDNATYNASVSISGMAFNPATISVQRGSMVVWTNNDSVAHAVVGNGNTFGSGTLYPGQTYQYTFINPGTYGYYDSIYPAMTGTVSVY